jgi:hypothetical protein
MAQETNPTAEQKGNQQKNVLQQFNSFRDKQNNKEANMAILNKRRRKKTKNPITSRQRHHTVPSLLEVRGHFNASNGELPIVQPLNRIYRLQLAEQFYFTGFQQKLRVREKQRC